jgi:hypothetical protein
MTVGKLLAETTAKELAEWEALYLIEMEERERERMASRAEDAVTTMRGARSVRKRRR